MLPLLERFRITKLHIVVEGVKFKKVNGKEVGKRDTLYNPAIVLKNAKFF